MLHISKSYGVGKQAILSILAQVYVSAHTMLLACDFINCLELQTSVHCATSRALLSYELHLTVGSSKLLVCNSQGDYVSRAKDET